MKDADVGNSANTLLHRKLDVAKIQQSMHVTEWLAVWPSGIPRWSTPGPVSAWMGDLRADKLSQYVTSHLHQLSLAIPPWVGAMSTSLGVALAQWPMSGK